MIDGQTAYEFPVETREARVRVLAAETASGVAAQAGGWRADTLVRSERPVTPELGSFLTRQLAAARGDVVDPATPTPVATLGALLALAQPWPVDLALLLLQRVAALLDTADRSGVVVGTFTPWCVVLSGRYLVLARHDARAGLDPAYIAPEQLRRGARVDGRASQYGLALLASTLLGAGPTATSWFGALRGRHAGADAAVAAGTLAPEQARAIDRVLRAARDPDPARRFASASEFIGVLGVACGVWTAAQVGLPADVATLTLPAPSTAAATSSVTLFGGMIGVAVVAGAMGWYAARRPVVIPPELANDIAIGRVLTDTARGSLAADLGPRSGAGRRDSFPAFIAATPGLASAAQLLDLGASLDSATPRTADARPISLPAVATSFALPTVAAAPLGSGEPRVRITSPAEFAEAGITQSLRREGMDADPAPQRSAPHVGSSGALDVAPTLLHGGSALPYPAALTQTRLEGDVVARFLIDSTGHVDPDSFEIIHASHPAFATAVHSALPHLQYRPGERAGHRVPATVEQRFRFAVPH